MKTFLTKLCDPSQFPLAEAVLIVKGRCMEIQEFDVEIINFLNDHLSSRTVSLDVVERSMHLLCAVSPLPRLLTVLRTAMQSYDPQIRSKAALVIGAKIESPLLLSRLTADTDPRVRANILETLWGKRTDAAEKVLAGALVDKESRVAANALYGLCQVNRSRYLSVLGEMASHNEPNRRRAAAWIVRKLGDMENAAILKPLLTDSDPAVRKAAFGTLIALRSAGGGVTYIPKSRLLQPAEFCGR